MKKTGRFWKRMWLAAAAFNFVIGVPIMLATQWTFSISYVQPVAEADALAIGFWRDFGIFVVLMGIGYYIVARDVTKNRGLAFLGVPAKMFDVISLTYRFAIGVATPIVLIPAVIDGVFAVLFSVFLYRTRSSS